VADGRLRVRLAAPATEGRANDELVAFLASRLGVRRGDVAVVAGGHSRRKRVRIGGVTLAEARRRLGV
jgi:uncharacterized protein (TIGR00251 family)